METNWIQGLPIEIDLNEFNELEGYFSDTDPFVVNESALEVLDPKKNLDRIVVVDNVPVIEEKKMEKLTDVLKKIFGQCGKIAEDGLELVFDENTGKTAGFCFITYKTAEEAKQAVKLVDGKTLDKKHTFAVNLYTDLEKYLSWQEKYVEPTIPEFKAPPNLRSWLLDEAGRDQYVIRHAQNTEIYWCEGIQMKGEGKVVYDGERERKSGKIWCEMYTAWSPKGTYFATYHNQGIALWGGSDFKKIQRFAHRGVRNLLFSPEENFIITWNGRDDNTDPRALIIWDIKTGKELRSFKVFQGSEWPIMRFSADDKYFARGTQDGISVFDSKTLKLLEKKPVKAKGMQQFDWSPSDNLIAYWAPEVDNMPARVVLIDPVTRREVRSKNLFNVTRVQLHWQDEGDFLCAQVLRHTKSGKTTFTNFEIFRMRDSNIPNEMLEVRDRIEHFSWEPKGHRFGIIHGPQDNRLDISFYTLGAIEGGDKIEKLYTVTGKSANILHWSPAGNNVILSSSVISGALEFWDVDENMSTCSTEHFMCNEIHWDPSGRMVATVVTQPMFEPSSMKYQLENGFNLWTFQGVSLRKVKMEHFYQFSWRPRPKSTLTKKEVQKVMKRLRGFMSKYSKIDQLRKKRMDTAANAEKISLLGEFRKRAEERAKRSAELLRVRLEMGLWEEEKEEEYETLTETEEYVLNEKTEPF
mmetsp:Transcript_3124/g.3525  ORF Transcript_3124/g.3525 Transcript_3124/m.3525 type:complete len:694 (+) Transcript_3124:107-2188(+)|eukprot:CAMPEP_0184013632 /NCGR_PEP_ID=MMETSP0954-20121128/5133_1 /TAXON_ID=627963 /ORGANISM="Aplanochytrium sp, Strain PBS07" /LENGTH=693 /DNA_ID=CAMNT_0026293867 /DNA_START=48 /DNA_END=2129 /DNA_ORIENTATION=+